MENTYVRLMIDKYRRKGVLVDTNLMLLLVMGTYDPDNIERYKRTQKYSRKVFDLVAGIVGQFALRFTTPNLFTEVDNLVRSDVAEKQRADVAWVLRDLINGLQELPTPSTVLAQHAYYGKIGLADCSILVVPDVLVLTDDLPLSSFLSNAGRAVINVSHLIAPDVGRTSFPMVSRV